ncbi:N-acetylmuramoyl-L-alanine amidase [Brevibacillus brevis]|uniref:N-acetylmuramoyl-L-alanine amidase n=1 Tax=Brevibacillus brevis TaxID=1393 RepID=UPI001F429A98|nr:N-acetylmuramoyl-L-alanine amidase [Brevibacillus brevis]UIO41860.1 N-acetylmuramoyl-L-alanine amidase [Brevibacillus brevis]
MNITEMLLTNVNSRPKKKIVPKGVVIHWTANERSGANATANRNYFNKPTTVASAHYIVDDKQIIRCLPEDEMGYHVGAQTYSQAALNKLSNYPNNCTIGIEMCVNADGSFAKMYEQTVALTADILKRHGWGVEHLWRHYDITGKNCPAFFVVNTTAQTYTGMPAKDAWAKFQQDVHRFLTAYPQKPQPDVDKCAVELTLTSTGKLIDDVSYVPIRMITEAVGGAVEWEPSTQKVTVNGQEVSYVNDQGTAFAKTRELAALLGLQVEWDEPRKAVVLKK